LAMKTEKALQMRICRWAQKAIILFVFFYLVITALTWIQMPHMTQKLRENPFLLIVALLLLLSILNVPREFKKRRYGFAFISSSASIFFLFCLFGMGTFPNLVRSTIDPEKHSLTFFNSAASPLTLRVLLIIVLIGIPLVLAYGTMVYRIFRGKVKIEPTSY
jgi:cytochrome bd ubiquinol oxidase subunit II